MSHHMFYMQNDYVTTSYILGGCILKRVAFQSYFYKYTIENKASRAVKLVETVILLSDL